MTVHSGGVGEVADIQVTEDGGGQAYGVASSSVVGGMRGDRDRVDRCASSHASAAVGLVTGGIGLRAGVALAGQGRGGTGYRPRWRRWPRYARGRSTYFGYLLRMPSGWDGPEWRMAQSAFW